MPIFTALNSYDDVALRSAAMNMAIDEALLEHSPEPAIRYYRWDHPALSFGYFGKFSAVAEHGGQRDLVRRWTGGGIVFHGDDLTYSLIIPATDKFLAASSKSIYAAIHSALRDALIANGQRAELVSVAALCERRNQTISAVIDRRYSKEACFANPVQADVLVNGRKVAGAAQRRTRAGLLHQGSIQLATGRVRPTGGHVDLGNGLAERFAKELSDDCSVKILGESLIERAHELAEEKYGSVSWLRRR